MIDATLSFEWTAASPARLAAALSAKREELERKRVLSAIEAMPGNGDEDREDDDLAEAISALASRLGDVEALLRQMAEPQVLPEGHKFRWSDLPTLFRRRGWLGQ